MFALVWTGPAGERPLVSHLCFFQAARQCSHLEQRSHPALLAAQVPLGRDSTESRAATGQLKPPAWLFLWLDIGISEQRSLLSPPSTVEGAERYCDCK